MNRYAYQPKSKNAVKVYGSGLRISSKSGALVCREVTGMSLPKAQQFTTGLVSKKRNLKGKYYTAVATSLSDLLKQAEASTEAKGFDPERMIVHASAHEGFTFRTPRRFKLRARKRKIAHLQLVLEQK